MDQGFGPKLSRVAAGACFILFFGLLDVFFGVAKTLAILILFMLLMFLSLVLFPQNPRVRAVVGWVLGRLP